MTTGLVIAGALNSVPATADRMPAPPTTGILDDKDDSWTWNGAKEFADAGLANGTGQAFSAPGFGVCVFQGTGVALYGMSGSTVTVDGKSLPFGKVKIWIDGHVKETVSLITPETEYSHKIIEVTGLKSGNHVVEVRAVEGEAVIDYLKPISTAGDTTPSDSPADGKQQATLYTDTFATGASDWVPFGGKHTVIDGHYVIEGGSGDKALQSRKSFRDLAYSCDIAMGAGGDCGIIFRVTNPTIGTDSYNGYYAAIDVAGRRIVLGRASNNWTVIGATPYPVQPNAVYNLKVIAVGSKINVYVNGQLQISAVDGTFSEGGIGVRVYNATGAFSNLHVSTP